MARFITLPESRVTVDADSVGFIMQQSLDEWVLVLRGFPKSPIVSMVDREAFLKFVDAAAPEAPSKLAVMEK